MTPGFPQGQGTALSPGMVGEGVHRTSPAGDPGPWFTHSGDEAMVAVLFGIENPVFDENRDGPQHEGHEQVHVDEIPGAVQFPVGAHQCRKRP